MLLVAFGKCKLIQKTVRIRRGTGLRTRSDGMPVINFSMVFSFLTQYQDQQHI